MVSGPYLELYYVSDGDTSVTHFVSELPEPAQQEAEALIRLLQEQRGVIEGGRLIPHGNNLFELRGINVRVFYKFSSDNRLILLQGLLTGQGEDINRIRRKAALV